MGIFFALYTESTLFPVRNFEAEDNSTLTSEVASPVVAVTVGPGISLDDINPPVTINLRIINTFDEFVSSYLVIRRTAYHDKVKHGCSSLAYIA